MITTNSRWLLIGGLFVALAIPELASAGSDCLNHQPGCLASQAVAASVNDEFDNGRIHEMYTHNVSQWMKNQILEAAFMASFSQPVAIISVGVQDRSIVQEGPAVDQVSNLPFYGRLYKVTLSNNAVYFETLSLIKENGVYKISGMNFTPSPTH